MDFLALPFFAPPLRAVYARGSHAFEGWPLQYACSPMRRKSTRCKVCTVTAGGGLDMRNAAQACLVAAALCAGCGKSTIEGEAFVVTRSANAVRLPLVSINFVKAEDFTPHLQKRADEHLQKLAELGGKIKKYRELAAANERERNELLALRQSGKPVDMLRLMNLLGEALVEHSAQQEYDQESSTDKGTIDPLMTDVPPAAGEVKTDSEGRFSIELPRGDYVAIAKATRLAGANEEVYKWLVKVKATSSTAKLVLSNHNMAPTLGPCCITILDGNQGQLERMLGKSSSQASR